MGEVNGWIGRVLQPVGAIIGEAQDQAVGLVRHQASGLIGHRTRVHAVGQDALLVSDDPVTMVVSLHVRVAQSPLGIPVALEVQGKDRFRLRCVLGHGGLSHRPGSGSLVRSRRSSSRLLSHVERYTADNQGRRVVGPFAKLMALFRRGVISGLW
jgi:hypothetical protein